MACTFVVGTKTHYEEGGTSISSRSKETKSRPLHPTFILRCLTLALEDFVALFLRTTISILTCGVYLRVGLRSTRYIHK